MSPESLRFSRTHEWISVEENVVVMGISDFAVRLLTDIVYLSLPKVGKEIRQGESIGEIESVKAVSDLYAPADGLVLEINQELPDQLQWLSESPFDRAWIAKIQLTRPEQIEQLMTYAEYVRHCEVSGH